MQIFDKLCELYKKVKPNADTSKITLNSRLNSDDGFDSLSIMLLALAIEDEFDIRFRNFDTLVSVKDICDYIQQETSKKERESVNVSAVAG